MNRRTGAIQQFMLRTHVSPLRHLWSAVYALIARTVAAWLGAVDGTTVYLVGSLASGEPVYGRSDIDLVAVVPTRATRDRVERRIRLMHRLLPSLRRLVDHAWIYDANELRAATSAPYPTYGLEQDEAAFVGAGAVPDRMGLLERPGLLPPRESWRRLRGDATPPAVNRTRQDERLAAWLELQYRWRWALLACADSRTDSAPAIATALAGAAGAWIALVTGEVVSGRRTALLRAATLLADQREPLMYAAGLQGAEGAEDHVAPLLWASFISISERIAARIDSETEAADAVEVELLGVPSARDRLPLLDWRGLALPRADWRVVRLPIAAQEHFSIAPGNLRDLDAVLDAARTNCTRHWLTLRSASLMFRPTLGVWQTGRLRGLENPISDPVSFALADGSSTATFRALAGWSAIDRARRAVAEHRAWLMDQHTGSTTGPDWVGGGFSAKWATPASLSMLISAARAALFLDSLERGSPRLAVTDEATFESWAALDPFAAESGQQVLGVLRAGEREPRAPIYEDLIALHDAVLRLPVYSSRRPYTTAAGGRTSTPLAVA